MVALFLIQWYHPVVALFLSFCPTNAQNLPDFSALIFLYKFPAAPPPPPAPRLVRLWPPILVYAYFSINFQLNIVSLSRKFCVYFHFTPLFTLWREHELRKRQSKFL